MNAKPAGKKTPMQRPLAESIIPKSNRKKIILAGEHDQFFPS
jgi:hypothetical protein